MISSRRRHLVVQSNQLVQARHRLSAEEQKIVKIMIAHIDKSDADFAEYEFKIRELADLLNITHKDPYGVLRSITSRLTTRPVAYIDPSSGDLIQGAWLAVARYRKGKGTVVLKFAPDLKPLLLQLKSWFTRYELNSVLLFKGKYTIRFFEIMQQFKGQKISEITYPLEELRSLLGLQKQEHKVYGNFKARVLQPACDELRGKSWRDIFLE